MAKRNPNRISELRLRKGWNQPELAERVGAHWVTISKLERGQMQLTQDWMTRLAKVLGVQPAELFSDPPSVRTLYMAGSLLDGGRVETNARRDTDNTDEETEFDVQIGAAEDERTLWFFVQTDAYYPYFHNGDVIRFTYITKKQFDKCYGRLCLIEVEGEDQSRHVGIPSRGAAAGTLDLQIPGGAVLRGVRAAEIAVASMALLDPRFIVDEDGYPLP